MLELLVHAAIALFVAALLLCAVSLGTCVARIRRRNRLHRRVPTPAPLHWLCSPSRPARLHRRLRDAVRTADSAAPLPPVRRRPLRRRSDATPAQELVEQLVVEAVAVDHQLTVAARAKGVTRGRLLDTSEGHVTRVEVLAGRVAVLAAATGASLPAGAGLDALAERLDAIEAGREEIAHLEALLHETP